MFLSPAPRVALVLGLVAITSTFLACSETTNSTTKPESQAAEHPSHDDLANAVFAGIETEPVQLTEGLWEGEPFDEGGASRPTVGLVKDFLLTGDVTGDGKQESVVLLWASSGGSGTFQYVAVAGSSGDGVINLGTAEFGDRVQVRAGSIVDGQIELDVVQTGPEDSACCPTQMATRVWEMGSEGLTEGTPQITGTMSLAELRGPEWVLTDLAWEEPAPSEPEFTLLFEEDGIAGNAGCNRYFGDVEEDAEMPTVISIGQLGSTQMMCPDEIMAVEARLLEQLGAVTRYGFLAGKLALSWEGDESGGVLLFSQRQPSP